MQIIILGMNSKILMQDGQHIINRAASHAFAPHDVAVTAHFLFVNNPGRNHPALAFFDQNGRGLNFQDRPIVRTHNC